MKKKQHTLRTNALIYTYEGTTYQICDLMKKTGLSYGGAVGRINNFNKGKIDFDKLIRPATLTNRPDPNEEKTDAQIKTLEEFRQHGEKFQYQYDKLYKEGHISKKIWEA